jgi:hypothetical protein
MTSLSELNEEQSKAETEKKTVKYSEELFSVVFLRDALTSAQELSKIKERYMLATIIVDTIVIVYE